MYIELFGMDLSIYSIITIIELIVLLLLIVPILKKFNKKEKELIERTNTTIHSETLRKEIIERIEKLLLAHESEFETISVYSTILGKIEKYDIITDSDIEKINKVYSEHIVKDIDELNRLIKDYKKSVSLGI